MTAKEIQDRLSQIKARRDNVSAGPYSNNLLDISIFAENPYGHGPMRIADMRGWGHLTGIGTCNMEGKDAHRIQVDNANFLAHTWTDIGWLLGLVQSLLDERGGNGE